MPGTKRWIVRIPVVLWNDLVVTGKLLNLVHKEIEHGMWEKGFIKVRHGHRWVWLSRSEIEAASAARGSEP